MGLSLIVKVTAAYNKNSKSMLKRLLFVLFFAIISFGRGEMSERSNVLAWKAGRP